MLIDVTELYKKAETSSINIVQSFQLLHIECGTLFRLLGSMNLVLISYWLISNQGREPYLGDFEDKTFSVSLLSDAY